MEVGAPVTLPLCCFGDPSSPFPCHRDAVVAIACVGVSPEGGPAPMFAASCREHRAPLKRFMDAQSADPLDPDLGVQFWPVEPFVRTLNLHDEAHPSFYELVRRSA